MNKKKEKQAVKEKKKWIEKKSPTVRQINVHVYVCNIKMSLKRSKYSICQNLNPSTIPFSHRRTTTKYFQNIAIAQTEQKKI